MIAFYVGYLSMIVTSMALVFSERSAVIMEISTMSIVLTLLSSSLNPFLHLWRMKDIRNEVKQLLKQVSAQETNFSNKVSKSYLMHIFY